MKKTKKKRLMTNTRHHCMYIVTILLQIIYINIIHINKCTDVMGRCCQIQINVKTSKIIRYSFFVFYRTKKKLN